MSTTQAIVLAAVVVVVLVVSAVWWTAKVRRRHQLQDRFGDEYEIVLDEHGSKRQAERELAARQERHDRLDIRPLDPEARLRYAEQWRVTQARFIEYPQRALEDAYRLVEDVMIERGYPVGDVDRQMADLSVEHSDVLDHYRAAHDVARESAAGQASTEHLRRGMVHYKALFAALLGDPADAPTSRT
jgi:hypothetical protein